MLNDLSGTSLSILLVANFLRAEETTELTGLVTPQDRPKAALLGTKT